MSANLGKKSQALDKASIISIAKKSLLASPSADAAVHVHIDGDEVPWHAVDTAGQMIAQPSCTVATRTDHTLYT